MLPIFNAGYWITNGFPSLEKGIRIDLIPDIPYLRPLESLSVSTKFLGFLVSLIPTGINVLAFLFLAQLFSLFQKLSFFSKDSVYLIKKIGTCILVNQLFYPIYVGLISLTLTFSNPPGTRVLSIAFTTKQASLLVVGIILLLTSWIMDEGRKLQEEQECTI